MPDSNLLSISSSASPRSLLHRPGFWLTVVVLLVVALAARHFKPAPPKRDPLHGDVANASGSLTEILAKTPVEQRKPLLLRYAQDASPGLRYAAIEALETYRDRETTDTLESAFRDSSATVREAALEALPDREPKRGMHLLLAGLQDSDREIRSAALGKLGARFHSGTRPDDRCAVPSLLTVLDDSDATNTLLAIHLLHQITGEPWTVKSNATPEARQAAIRQWKDWWQKTHDSWALPPECLHVAAQPPTRTDPAPDFDLRDIEGKPLRLAEQRGRVTLLNFWGTWCGSCQQEIPDLVKLDQTYRSQNLDIIGIALASPSESANDPQKESKDDLRRWCQARGVGYWQTIALPEMLDAYGDVYAVPVSILIDRQGNIRYRWEGPRDFETFRAAVERLLREEADGG